MKKILLIAGGSLLLLTFSCNKTSDGNKNVIKQENTTPELLPTDSLVTKDNTAEGDDDIIENTVRYVAEDGSSALVTFKTRIRIIRSVSEVITRPFQHRRKRLWQKAQSMATMTLRSLHRMTV